MTPELTLADTMPAVAAPGPAQTLYSALLRPALAEDTVTRAYDWLDEQLEATDALTCDMPADPAALPAWLAARNAKVGQAYTAYLAERRAGAPRRYFSCKAHALYFLRGVAPTKRVDGAWLYGLVHRWHDVRFDGLVSTYLEELGEGDPQANHVAMYERLLAETGCTTGIALTDEHYVQGAIQLALAHGAERYLPEIVGFNLGYEQLPLHLLITAYEFNELGLDPYYFTVHITGDNAHSGHARQALDSVEQVWPVLGDDADFARRLQRGYLLNDLGAGTVDVIQGFDLQAELCRILVDKSAWGRHAHSDYCRIEGRTVNEWLSDPADTPALLQALVSSGWIRRGQPPSESRFWRLLQGERAEMFGVFTPYEQQVLADWILDGAQDAAGAPRTLTFRARRRLREAVMPAAREQGSNDGAESDPDVVALRERVEAASTRHDAMRVLAGVIGPATHATPAGFVATQLFGKLRRAA